MKIHRQGKRPIALLVVVVAAAIALLGGGYLVYATYLAPAPDNGTETQDQQTQKPSGTVDYGAPTDEQIDAGADQKDETDGGNESPAAGDSLSVTMTNAVNGEIYATGSVAQFRTMISKVTSSGKCVLTLKQGTTVVTKQADIQAQAQFSTCKGFDVPLSELGAGTWSATITVTSGDMKGEATATLKV